MTFTFKEVANYTRRPVTAAALWLAAAAFCAPGTAVAQSAEELRLTAGKSIVIDYPEDIRQISTTDPLIVDATAITTREILLNAKGLGSATMVVWSASNQRMFYNVTVDLNTESLKRILRDTFPNERIEVRNSGDSISLNGVVSSKEVAERAAALAGVVAKVVVNNLTLTAEKVSQQVLLHVKFIELDRKKAQEYGINFQSTGAFNFLGSLQTAAISGPNLAGAFQNVSLSIAAKALQNRNILQILAEPTLVTTDGKEGNFLVGGETPVPVIQGGNNTNSVTIMYREFGVRLRYTPQITMNKTIKLNLFQEVSALDYTNATTLAGFIIPAISTRRAETSIELGEGETYAIAGLLDNRETEAFASIPGISSIPILGNLFKNKVENKQNTELIVLVTPEITMPLGPNDPKPEIVFPNDFLKRITQEDVEKARKAVKP
jgi:pilus assembly protein CpaC